MYWLQGYLFVFLTFSVTSLLGHLLPDLLTVNVVFYPVLHTLRPGVSSTTSGLLIGPTGVNGSLTTVSLLCHRVLGLLDPSQPGR